MNQSKQNERKDSIHYVQYTTTALTDQVWMPKEYILTDQIVLYTNHKIS